MEFKGGYTYIAKVSSSSYDTCTSEIELEKYRYNKSLNSGVVKKTRSARKSNR